MSCKSVFRPVAESKDKGLIPGLGRILYGIWHRAALRGLCPFPTRKVSVRQKADFWRGLGIDPNHPGDGILIAAAHDDDPGISVPLLIQVARSLDIQVHLVIATDGSQGYCSLADKDDIVQIRREETNRAYELLQLDPDSDISWLGFPDTRLSAYQGRFTPETLKQEAVSQRVALSGGFTGLENALVDVVREVSPKMVVMPTPTDLHNDHRVVASEISIVIFHALGAIWPELGTQLGHVPEVFECATYCNYSAPPTTFIQASDEMFERGLEAVSCWKSQVQIEALVQRMRQRGPIEFLRRVEWDLYEPTENLRYFNWSDWLSSYWNRFYHGSLSRN